MFASEKVMLDYLSQLLTDEQPEPETEAEVKLDPALQVEVESQVEAEQELEVDVKAEPVVTQDTELEPVVEPELTKKTESIQTSAVNKETKEFEKPELRLQPISSRVNQLKAFKEDVITLSEPSSVEKLLQQVDVKEQVKQAVTTKVSTETIKETKLETEVQVAIEPEAPTADVEEQIPEEPFQALFFDVAGLVLAVPLQELGGIHNLTEINSLFGKPDWFKGVMINREKKLNVVDSARWVMPEKFDQQMEDSLEYKYLITLGQSEWGLAAEKLVETESIHPDAVKWRSKPGKRPWLYGTIKEKMCALLHVSDLIAMLEQGINARQE